MSVRQRGTIGGLRVLRVDVRDIAEHVVRVHGLVGLAAELAIDGVAAASLLAAYLDDDERLTLQIQGAEPRFALTVDVHDDGAVRGRLTPNWVPEPDGPLQGVLMVMKSVVGREVYRGVTPLEHHNLAAMLQQHLEDSAQAPARVALRDGVGAFVEKLPDEAIDDATMDQVLQDVLDAFDGADASEERELFWSCSCSRDKVLQMLVALGPEEIRSMIDEDDGARVSCHFCNETVVLDRPALEALL